MKGCYNTPKGGLMEKKAAEMNVTMEQVSELVPAEYNPRRAISGREREALKSSITEYGMVYPVVVNDRTGRIVGGHQRVSVLKELGIEEAPVVHVDMDEEQEKRANIALNAIEADWDIEKLQELVHPMTAEEVQALGWSKVEAEALLAGLFMNRDTKKAMLEELRDAADGGGDAEGKDERKQEEQGGEKSYTCPKCGYSALRHEFVGDGK